MRNIKTAEGEHISSVDTMLTLKELFLFGMQHIAAMCAGAMAVPIILGNSLGLSYDQISILVAASFMMAGIGTIIQTLGIGKKIGSKLPMIEGVSFAGVAALTAVGVAYRDVDSMLGIQVMMGATIISGIFCIIIAPVFG